MPARSPGVAPVQCTFHFNPVLQSPPPPSTNPRPLRYAHLPVLCTYDELQPLKQAMGNEAVVQLEEALAAQWVAGTHAQQEEALHLVEHLITQLLQAKVWVWWWRRDVCGRV